MDENNVLLGEAAGAGILLYTADGRLKAKAADGAMTDLWKQRIGAHKDGLLAALQQRPLPLAAAAGTAGAASSLDGAGIEAALAESEAFWRTHLAGAAPVQLLPTDDARAEPHAAHWVDWSWPVAVDADALARRAGEADVPLQHMLHAVCALLVARWSGQSEAVVGVRAGTLLTNAARVAWDHAVDNVLPVRCGFDRTQTLDGWLQSSSRTLCAVLAHRALPLAQARGVAASAAALEVGFVCTGTPTDAGSSATAGSESGVFPQTGARDLELALHIDKHAVQGRWRYDARLFREDTVRRLAESLDSLLAALCGVAHAPERAGLLFPGGVDGVAQASPATLPMLGCGDVSRLLAWQGTMAPPAFPGGVHAMFVEHAHRAPEALALVCAERRLNYGELDRLSDRLALRLREEGLVEEAPVAICMGRSADWIVAVLAILKAGGAYLPLDPKHPIDRLRYMIEDSGTRIIATDSAHLETFAALAECAIAVDLEQDDGGAVPPQCAAVRPEQLAYMVYTSGSTGLPKGVMLSHAALSNLQRNEMAWFDVGPDSRVLQFSSISFDVATWDWTFGLTTGASLYVCTEEHRRSPAELQAYLVSERITHGMVPPALLAHMDPTLPYALEGLMVIGEALEPVSGWRWAARQPLFNAYGPSEATVVTSIAKIEDGVPVTIGRPLSHYGMHVLDDAQQPVPIGVAGELVISGIGVGMGYLNRPELNAEKFLGDPAEPMRRAYRTGDLVRLRMDGEFEFLGRIDDQVKIRGHRIELGEINTRIKEIGGVREAFTVAHGQGEDKRLIAYVAPDVWPPAQGEQSLAQRIRAGISTHLPQYMLPSGFVFLASLPVNINGKVDRKQLPPPDRAVQASADYLAPRDEREETLCTIWADVLKLERVGIHDRFFAIGGDSILLIQAVARANRAGLRVSARDMHAHQTVAELAAALHALQPAVPAAEVAVGEVVPLLPLQHAFLARAGEASRHFNQAIVLEVPAALDEAALRAAAEVLYRRHDVLQLRFERAGDAWQAVRIALDDAWLRDAVQVERLPADGAWTANTIALCERHQQAVDPLRGPLLRLVLFAHPQSPRLVLIAHHLVVDGVSWRGLLDELAPALAGMPAGMAAGPSFAVQAQRQHAMAIAGAFDAERERWRQAYAQAPARLPCDRTPPPALCHAEDASLEADLGVDTGAARLEHAARTYRCGPQELLLAAFAMALDAWTGSERQWITVEGHGRAPLPDGSDPGQAIGWFTSTYPVAVGVRQDDIGATIRAAKEAIRTVPAQGIGHGWATDPRIDAELAALAAARRPQVLFNYLGRFDGPADGALRLSRASAGRTVGAHVPRAHLLGLNAAVVDDTLQLSLEYSAAVHDADTIRRLLDDTLEALERSVSHCAGTDPVWTPSDFPLARVEADELDAWQARYAIRDLYPATPMQKGMMFQSLLRPDAYVTQVWPEFEGELDPDAMHRAWQWATDRHDALRTAFVGEIDRLQQLVVEHAELEWRSEDWRAMAPEQRAEAFARYREDDRRRAFDPACAPQQRVALFRMEDRRWTVLWTHQHMLVDGWSLPLVYRDVLAAYAEFRAQRVPTADEPVRYAHYVDWLYRQDVPAAIAHWKRRLADVVLPTPLLAAGEHAPTAGEGVRRVDWSLDPADAARLTTFAQANELTLFSVIQLAWACVLSVRSGLRDVVYGATVSGRSAEVPGVESMVGLFINSLPVRASLDPEASVEDAARALQAAFREDDLHGHLALGELRKHCAPGHQGRLFDSLLVFENYPLEGVGDEADDGAPRLVAAGDDQQTEFAATLSAMLADRLYLRLVTRRERIADEVAAALEHAFVAVLRAIPDAIRLRDLDVCVRPQVQPAGDEMPLDVVSLISAVARATPDAVAAEAGGRTLRYADLLAQAERVATRLRAQGVGDDAIVGVLTHGAPEMLPVLLGIMKAGAAYLPLDPTYPQERLQAMLEVGRPARLVAASAFLAQAEATGLPVSALEGLLADHSDHDTVGLAAAVVPPQAPHPEAAAYVIFTSGSTGRPKGVWIAHASLARLATRMAGILSLRPDDRVLQFAPISFDVSVQEIFSALVAGARLLFLPPGMAKLGDGLIAHLREQRITVATLPPAVLVSSRPVDLPDLRLVVSGAEPLSAQVVAAWSEGRRFSNQYGPTETTVTATARDCPADAAPNIGWPIAGVLAYLVDEHGRPTPAGGTGELLIGGEAVGLGYVHDPAATAEKFRPDPFSRVPGARLYRTGDLARRLEDGAYEFAGRNDGQVKLRGFRIELGDVESALLRHPEVEHAAALVVGHGEDDRRLVAYVQSAAAERPGFADELRLHMEGLVASYMCPGAIVPMAALPIGVNGKIDRARLPEPFAPGEAGDGGAAAGIEAGSDVALIAAVFAEVIGVAAIPPDRNFFHAGGDSLLAVKAASRIGASLGIELNVAWVIEAPTAQALAARLSRDDDRRRADQLLREIEAMSEEDVMRLLESDAGATLGNREELGI